ncbi:MAG: hypothetical protein H7269_13755, partial [Cellulomonas sp.]|nr:hypothetical protein [Cellulomonas sp.]
MQQHAHEGPWRGHRRCPYPSFRRGGGRPAAVGGGVVGLIVLLGAVFFNVDLSGVANLADGGSGGASGSETIGSVDDCTAEQANTERGCRLSATAQSLDAT